MHFKALSHTILNNNFYPKSHGKSSIKLKNMNHMIPFQVIIYLYLMLFMIPAMKAQEEAMLYYCNDTSFSPDQEPGKTYRTNLNEFLWATAEYSRTVAFRSLTYGDGANKVYGIFLCRGDVNSDACSKCVSNASREVLDYCYNQMVAYTWYSNCFLRYSNKSFFGHLDTGSGMYAWNPFSFDPETSGQFNGLVKETMEKTARKAAYDSQQGKLFGVGEANTTFAPYDKFYTFAECTPDLNRSDCDLCLSIAISYLPRCCNKYTTKGGRVAFSKGGRIAFSSCNIRFELFKFYNISQGVTSPPPPPPPPPPPSKGSRISVGVVVAIALSIASCILLFILTFVFYKRRSLKRQYSSKRLDEFDEDEDDITIDPESLQYSLSEIENATNMFSVDNKIGQGGFGSVYKGKLPNGQEIAVKRLSKSSGQGVAEFKNEIAVVAKLQHRNLVQLLGFCLEGKEKILVYEFVPRRSLDYFLFDPEKQVFLNWSRRRNIIGGIARGLLYLHEDSRLKIVHRDLKAGNILLDESMNPKIADFGMAKICGIDESEGNTNRIAGTFGYMAPEYTRSGQYSVKSDVFSFGVVLLEIITGKKNSSFYQSEVSEDLISYAWRQWRDGTPLALLDPTIGDSYVITEVTQRVHISLLCVEEDPNKRPTMASVVYMLNSTSVSLPIPHHPAVLGNDRLEKPSTESRELLLESINEVSFTEPYPR